MKRTVLTLILLLSISSLSFSQAEATQIESVLPAWEILSEDSYEIRYPADWTIDKSGLMGTKFLILSQLTDTKDIFAENVNLVIQDISGHNISLDEYVALSEDQIKTMITEGVLLSSIRVKEEEREYQKVIFTGKQGIYDLKFEQYYFLLEGMAYILTLTCEVDQFEEYRVMGEEIMNSFAVK